MPPTKNGLVETIKADETRDLLAEGTAAVIDALSDPEFTGQIPVAGLVAKTYQASKSIRERMRIKKLAKFLEYSSQMSEEEKNKFAAQFENADKEEEFGEQVLVLIEQAEETEKPKIIGKLLVAHAKGHYDLPTYMRLSKMVSRAFIEDFQYLENMRHNSPQQKDSNIEQGLYLAGFLRLSGFDEGEISDSESSNEDIIYEITIYGKWLVDLGLSEDSIPVPEVPIELFS